MLLVVFLVLWVAVLAAGAAIYAVRPQGPGVPWPRWLGPVATFSAVGLGVGLPALAVIYSSGERDRTARSGIVLTDAQVHGRTIFDNSCKRCHSLADASAASTIGPDLDVIQPAFVLTVDAIEQGRARGNGQMPKGLTDAAGARDVASYLEAVAGRAGR